MNESMNIYARKERWKWGLLIAALIIFGGTFYFTDHLVKKVASEERRNVKLWAEAVNRKASLVRYTEKFFLQLQEEERRRVLLLAKAYDRLVNSSIDEDVSFYLDIISNNTTIPVILTDQKGVVNNSRNVAGNLENGKHLPDSLKTAYSQFDPIVVKMENGEKNYVYYKESIPFTELKSVLNDLTKSFLDEVVTNSASVPVVITDSLKNIIASGNIEPIYLSDSIKTDSLLISMKEENGVMRVDLGDQGPVFIYYKSSPLLYQIRYYPLVQLGIVGLFLLIAYLLFSSARRSEQNQVWVGMSKETAHQLGTPLSSMLAWIELLRLSEVNHEAVDELEKDVKRLEIITERFSKIGSTPQLETINLVEVIYQVITYLKVRTSKKIEYSINLPPEATVMVSLNRHLFEWVIENLTRNAVDAMSGIGTFHIDITENEGKVMIDFTDSGKGIPRRKFKTVFQPGYSTKLRGWGLGLTLARRIIRSYHKGKIFVKSSTIDKGTTFRIVLNK